MPASPTTKWALIARASSDAISTIAAGEQAFLGLIDGYLTPWSSGTLASRPAAAKSGRRYLATDVGQFGVEYVDTGAAWIVAPGMVKLAEWTAASNGQTPDFQNIPQGFKNLLVEGSLRSTRPTLGDTGLRMILNANTSALYQHVTAPIGSTATGGSSETYAFLGQVAAGGATAGAFSGVVIELPSYSGTANFKTIRARTQGSMTSGLKGYDTAAEFTTTGAISRVHLDDDVTGGFATGSTIALYGLA